MDSPSSLNASFVKDQDGFDDVDAFFNQAVTPSKTPKAKAASVKATPSRTPLKANGLVAKPVAIISSKIAAHYRKEPRLAVSMSEVTLSQEPVESDPESVAEYQSEEADLVESTMETSNEEATTMISGNNEIISSTKETKATIARNNEAKTTIASTNDASFTFSSTNAFTSAHAMSYEQYQFDHDNYDPGQNEDDALVNQMVEEMLVDTDQLPHPQAEQVPKTPTKVKGPSKAVRAKSVAPRSRRQATYFPGAEFDENGTRRSKRQRMSPLRYWANEKVCYGRADDPSITLPVIVNVIKKPELDDPTFMMAKSTRPRQFNPNSVRLKAQAFGPHVEAEGYVRVINEDGQEEEEQRLLALSHHNVEGDPVKGNSFKIHTMFTEGSYMSAGQLLFPTGATKPAKNSARHALVFYVIAGSFEVIVHETKFLIGPGGQFHVPRNNAYSIAHISNDKAVEGRLFFCHCKDNREN